MHLPVENNTESESEFLAEEKKHQPKVTQFVLELNNIATSMETYANSIKNSRIWASLGKELDYNY